MKKRLKPLLPSLREKKRYVAFEVHSTKPIKEEYIKEALAKAFLSLAGTLGTADSGFVYIPEVYDAHAQKGIIRVSHTAVDLARAALVSIRDIGGVPSGCHVTHVSGMIKQAKSA